LFVFNDVVSLSRVMNMKPLIPHMLMLEIISMKGYDGKFLSPTLMYYDAVKKRGKLYFYVETNDLMTDIIRD
jgi:hypothetical protein